jgi:hypothetical protein
VRLGGGKVVVSLRIAQHEPLNLGRPQPGNGQSIEPDTSRCYQPVRLGRELFLDGPERDNPGKRNDREAKTADANNR